MNTFKRLAALIGVFAIVALSGCASVPGEKNADTKYDFLASASSSSGTPTRARQACATEGLGTGLIPGKPNIILVYGFTQTPEAMLPLKETMECRGWNVIIPDLGWNIEGTDAITEHLLDVLHREDALLHAHYGIGLADMKDDLVLFGHSRGGLSIVNAQRIDRSLLPLHVVTAGSAFGGIPLGVAVAIISQAARDTFPGSGFLSDLKEDMRTHPRDLLQVTSSFDWLVPAMMNVVEGYPHYVASIWGHLALGTDMDPKVFESRLPKYFPNTKIETTTTPYPDEQQHAVSVRK